MFGLRFDSSLYRLGNFCGVLPEVGIKDLFPFPAGCKNPVTFFSGNDLRLYHHGTIFPPFAHASGPRY